MGNLWQKIKDWFNKHFGYDPEYEYYNNMPLEIPPTATDSFTKPVSIDTLVDWNYPMNCRHNIRVLCDLSGLTLHEKDVITACIRQESAWYNYLNGKPVKHENKNVEGKLLSTDWGIVQINDFYHIGQGKDFPSVNFVMANPQKCVQFMIDCYKQGNLGLWSSYKTGAYLQYMPK